MSDFENYETKNEYGNLYVPDSRKSGLGSLVKATETNEFEKSVYTKNPVVAYFEKISFNQWIRDSGLATCFLEEMRMPQRSTEYSAGYDFFSAANFMISANSSFVVPTGIRVKFINPSFFLGLYPRSGLGFKHRISLSNTIGIIDYDYYFSDNEGHVMVKLYNPNDYDIKIQEGDAYCQGIFQLFGITRDDDMYEKKTRNGGFGSTSSSK